MAFPCLLPAPVQACTMRLVSPLTLNYLPIQNWSKYEVHGALESSLGFPGVSKLWFFLFSSSSPQICTDCILIGPTSYPRWTCAPWRVQPMDIGEELPDTDAGIPQTNQTRKSTDLHFMGQKNHKHVGQSRNYTPVSTRKCPRQLIS